MDQLDWDKNVDPNFKDNHYLEPVPVADTRKEGFVDRWIVYGKVDGEQLFTAKELTVEPGVKCALKDTGAYGLFCVQGRGKIKGQPLNSPKRIRFHELTGDKYFFTKTRKFTGGWKKFGHELRPATPGAAETGGAPSTAWPPFSPPEFFRALDGGGRGVLGFAARFGAGGGVAAGPCFNHRGR